MTLTYRDGLSQAMRYAATYPRAVFLGQGVVDKGTFMSRTMTGVPKVKRIELPVMEECQLGISIGMALDGLIPITLYPRWNFLLLAANQMVNYLDKMRAHVIIRVGIGSSKPLDPGPQHTGNFTAAFKQMMPNTTFVELEHATAATAVYGRALDTPGPWVIVEDADRYDMEDTAPRLNDR